MDLIILCCFQVSVASNLNQKFAKLSASSAGTRGKEKPDEEKDFAQEKWGGKGVAVAWQILSMIYVDMW